LLAAAPAWGGKGVALVIGHSAYENVTRWTIRATMRG